jgi:hypothetical protein
MWARMGLAGAASGDAPSSDSALTRDLQAASGSAPGPHRPPLAIAGSEDMRAQERRTQAQRLTTQQAQEDAERLEAAGAVPIRHFERSSSGHIGANSLRLGGGNALQFGARDSLVGCDLYLLPARMLTSRGGCVDARLCANAGRSPVVRELSFQDRPGPPQPESSSLTEEDVETVPTLHESQCAACAHTSAFTPCMQALSSAHCMQAPLPCESCVTQGRQAATRGLGQATVCVYWQTVTL